MGFWSDWQASRDRRRRVASYVTGLLHDADPADVQWLAETAKGERVAARELVFARRALGLIVAERDALDDRTAADVAHQLAPAIRTESLEDSDAGRAWSERWRAYKAALALRGSAEPPAVRLARVLLEGAGVTSPTADQLERASSMLTGHRRSLNQALRAAFGDAMLPDDIRPSAIAR